MSEQPAAGWYQRPMVPEEDRYWDGAQWTDQVRPHVSAPDQEPPPQREAPAAVSQRAASAPTPEPAVAPDPPIAQVAAAEPSVAQYTAAASGAMQKALESDVVRQRRGELFIVGGNVLLLIALIMPWFHIKEGLVLAGSSFNAFETRGLMYIVLIVLLATVAYVLSRIGRDGDRSRSTNWRVLITTTGLNLGLSLFTFLAVPTGLTWSYGGFIGVAAAITAFVGALRVRKERKSAALDATAR